MEGADAAQVMDHGVEAKARIRCHHSSEWAQSAEATVVLLAGGGRKRGRELLTGDHTAAVALF